MILAISSGVSDISAKILPFHYSGALMSLGGWGQDVALVPHGAVDPPRKTTTAKLSRSDLLT
jgi:hypothetical protein